MYRTILTTAALLAVVAGSTSAAQAGTSPTPRPTAPAVHVNAAHLAPSASGYAAAAPAAAYTPTGTGAVHQVHLPVASPGGQSAPRRWEATGPVLFDPGTTGGINQADGLTVDPTIDATPGAVWFLRAPLLIGRGGWAGCIRLWDVTANAVVSGSGICVGPIPETFPTIQDTCIYDSAPFSLPDGRHLYVVQGINTAGPGDAAYIYPLMPRGVELIGRWTDQ